VCQTGEPASLYLYSDDGADRAAIFDALFDGPIDSNGYAHQPVILTDLPTLANGGATLAQVTLNPGDNVVDAVSGAVVPLAAGVELYQLDGSRITYGGEGSATAVQVSAQFTLKTGLRWSDGAPLTADDSVYAYDIARAAVPRLMRFVLARTARYELVDTLTTRWVGLPGWLDTDFQARFWPPLPRHAYGMFSPSDLSASAEVNQRPLGWGAFRAAGGVWETGKSLTLWRNPYYFRAADGLPQIDRVIFRFGLTPDQIVTDLQAGQCDVGVGDALGYDFTDQIPALLAARNAQTLNVQFRSAATFEHLDFGIAPAETYKRAAGQDLFADRRMRQAVAYCLDRQALIDQLLHGISEVPAVYVPADHPLFGGAALTRYAFDPAQGQALLAELGWVDRDGDGIRDGGRARLTMRYASGPPDDAFRAALATFVQTQLRENCGIEVTPEFYDPATLYDAWPSGVVFGRQFDLASFPWRAGAEPPCELYTTQAMPSDSNPAGANNTGYGNPQFDAACQSALTTLDENGRRQHHLTAQALFTQDLPALPLFFRVKVGVVTLRVTGFDPAATARSDLWNVETWALNR
jgi:peptide/nickel transport system substrate-binding protein